MKRMSSLVSQGGLQTFGRAFAAVVALLAAPGTAAAAIATPYDVEISESVYQPLPIEGGGPVTEVLMETDYFDQSGALTGGSGWLSFPFPVRFFGTYYGEGAAAAHGFLSFGPRSETLCGGDPSRVRGTPATYPSCANHTGFSAVAPGPLPREVFPNRLIAAWWSDTFHCGSGSGFSAGAVRQQTIGEAPNRSFVVEWANCNQNGSSVDVQVWLREGAADIEVHYGPRMPMPDLSTAAARRKGFAGLMSPVVGGPAEGYNGLFCSKTPGGCEVDSFPAGQRLTYIQGTDLAISEVFTDASIGVAGRSRLVTARMSNLGGSQTRPATVRFLLSSRPDMDGAAVELAQAGAFHELAMDESVELSAEVVLPLDLAPGTYYVIAQADPTHAEPTDRNPGNNVKASPPIVLGPRMPLLSVRSVVTPAAIEPASSFNLSWRIRNDGSDAAPEIPFAVMLSSDETISLADRLLGLGQLSIETDSEQSGDLAVEIPADVLDGVYYIGVLIDPDQTLPSAAVSLGGGASEPVHIISSELRILTTSLPSATLGAGYCLRLDAAGGGGRASWSVEAGSSLPPGLRLDVLPAGAMEEGRPFFTMLCGSPSAAGSFTFALQVSAGPETRADTYDLEVGTVVAPLQVVASELPTAAFMAPYEARLRGTGGRAPYHWKLVDGRLPTGLALRSDGAIIGAPAEDGRSSVTVRLTDSEGRGVERALAILVAPPTRLTCGTRMLPAHQVDETYSISLTAAGGSKPYRWRSRETRRLAGEPGESAVALGVEPPPGITLSGAGEVGGAPSQSGRFLWTVEVTDAARPEAEDLCTIVVDVAPVRGLTVSTMGLMRAVVGHPYRATLAASGSVGSVVWTLAGGSRLPTGLVLTADGVIEGIPEFAQLESRPARDFPFLVEARDSQNRRGVAPLSIEVVIAPSSGGGASAKESGGGCAAGLGGGVGLAVLAALIWTKSNKRRSLECR